MCYKLGHILVMARVYRCGKILTYIEFSIIRPASGPAQNVAIFPFLQLVSCALQRCPVEHLNLHHIQLSYFVLVDCWLHGHIENPMYVYMYIYICNLALLDFSRLGSPTDGLGNVRDIDVSVIHFAKPVPRHQSSHRTMVTETVCQAEMILYNLFSPYLKPITVYFFSCLQFGSCA